MVKDIVGDVLELPMRVWKPLSVFFCLPEHLLSFGVTYEGLKLRDIDAIATLNAKVLELPMRV